MLSASKSVESLRVGSSEGCVSISLNDSWTGKKLLDYIDHDSNLHMTSKEFQVRKMNLNGKRYTYFALCTPSNVKYALLHDRGLPVMPSLWQTLSNKITSNGDSVYFFLYHFFSLLLLSFMRISCANAIIHKPIHMYECTYHFD